MRYLITITLILAVLLGMLALWMKNSECSDSYSKEISTPETGVRTLNYAASDPLPLETIIKRLSLPKDTRILEIEREHRSRIMHYDIELITVDGKIYKIHINPYTAEIVEREDPL